MATKRVKGLLGDKDEREEAQNKVYSLLQDRTTTPGASDGESLENELSKLAAAKRLAGQQGTNVTSPTYGSPTAQGNDSDKKTTVKPSAASGAVPATQGLTPLEQKQALAQQYANTGSYGVTPSEASGSVGAVTDALAGIGNTIDVTGSNNPLLRTNILTGMAENLNARPERTTGDATQQAYNSMMELAGARPDAYQSRYQGQIDSALQNLQNMQPYQSGYREGINNILGNLQNQDAFSSDYRARIDNVLNGLENQQPYQSRYAGQIDQLLGQVANPDAYQSPYVGQINDLLGQVANPDAYQSPYIGQINELLGQVANPDAYQSPYVSQINDLLGQVSNPEAYTSAYRDQMNDVIAKMQNQQYDSRYQGQIDSILAALGSPTPYESKYRDEMESLLQGLGSRQGFSYKPENDALYRSYRDQYIRLGNRAMQDAMASAAGLTGGYGSSYAQGVGQQAYQDHLSNLNGKLLELAQLAYNQYNNDTANMYNRLSALNGMDQSDYARYRDSLTDQYNLLSALSSLDNNEYGRFRDSVSDQMNAFNMMGSLDSTDYNRYQNELANRYNALSALGAQESDNYNKYQNELTNRYNALSALGSQENANYNKYQNELTNRYNALSALASQENANYNKYQNELTNRYNALSALAGQDNTDYNRYQNGITNQYNLLNALGNQYSNDYNEYRNRIGDQYDLMNAMNTLDSTDYTRYQNDLTNRYNMLNTLGNLDSVDYNRYRDTVGDWQTDRNWWTNRYDTETGNDFTRYEQDMAAWQADRDYWKSMLQYMEEEMPELLTGTGSGGGSGKEKQNNQLTSAPKEKQQPQGGSLSSDKLGASGMVGTSGLTAQQVRDMLTDKGIDLTEIDKYVAERQKAEANAGKMPIFDLTGVPDKNGQIVVPAGSGDATGGKIPVVTPGGSTTQTVKIPIDAWTGADPSVQGAISGGTAAPTVNMVGSGLDTAALEELARMYGIPITTRK